MKFIPKWNVYDGHLCARGAEKSLARPGRKQARKHVRDARDFNNIETRAVTKFSSPPARQGAEKNISLFKSVPQGKHTSSRLQEESVYAL